MIYYLRMNVGIKKAVIIPAYRVSETITSVIDSIPQEIEHIIVVDDACPESSGKIAEGLNRTNLIVLYHEKTRGWRCCYNGL